MSRPRTRDERGAVAILVAACITALLIAVAMVLDFGIVRTDRQMNKSSADAATTAGLRALDQDTGFAHSYAGICQALTYLKLSQSELSALPLASNQPSGNVNCPPSASELATPCVPGVTSNTYAATMGRFQVTIQSPYKLPDGNYREDSLSSLSGDTGVASQQGCDQLAVIVTETKKPGLGSLATQSDLVSRIRSVGRVTIPDGKVAPALILLEPKKCNVLTIGSANVGEGNIWVKGAGSVSGSIHADSDGTGTSSSPGAGSACDGSNGSQLFNGKHANGIVASGATTVTMSGSITSVAGYGAVSPSVIYDSINNVYSTSATTNTGGGSAPTGRGRVGRDPVDERYAAGVRTAITNARSYWSLTYASLDSTWEKINSCTPSAADLTALAAATAKPKVYIECAAASGIKIVGTIPQTTVVFNGFIKAGSAVSMPNAKDVYVTSQKNNGEFDPNAINLTNNDAFCMRSATCPASSPTVGCGTSPTGDVNQMARLFVRTGTVNASGGLLRLCSTTAFMLGGDSNLGCVPLTNGTDPSVSPCPSPNVEGTGQLSITGSALLDWTAPNAFGSLAAVDPSTKRVYWRDYHEDLALWAESYADNDNSGGTPYSFAGSGAMQTRGVFMVPNADAFTLGGQSNQTLVNAQYIVRRFATGGQGALTMTVDPEQAVTVSSLDPFTLVR